MASFDRSFSSSSPVLVLAPQPVQQYPIEAAPFAHHDLSMMDSPQAAGNATGQNTNARSRPATGRKRSRDEASFSHNEEYQPLVPIEAIPEDEDDFEYGPGMTLIRKSRAGYVADASSQSGTWVEERAAEEEAKRKAAIQAQQHVMQDRPELRSHKSQRRETMTTPSDSQEFLSGRSSPVKHSPGPSSVSQLNIHLGVGWSGIADDEHIQAAARGWARYIENHYGLSNVVILLQSKGLQSYFASASEGYFLFDENLRQGQLVSTDKQQALQNLKHTPPIFDSPQVLHASDTPISTASTPQTSQTYLDADMDIDMS